MQKYGASTWFGVSHGEIAASFDFSHKVRTARSLLKVFSDSGCCRMARTGQSM